MVGLVEDYNAKVEGLDVVDAVTDRSCYADGYYRWFILTTTYESNFRLTKCLYQL